MAQHGNAGSSATHFTSSSLRSDAKEDTVSLINQFHSITRALTHTRMLPIPLLRRQAPLLKLPLLDLLCPSPERHLQAPRLSIVHPTSYTGLICTPRNPFKVRNLLQPPFLRPKPETWFHLWTFRLHGPILLRDLNRLHPLPRLLELTRLLLLRLEKSHSPIPLRDLNRLH
jgi:hypothetical protein